MAGRFYISGGGSGGGLIMGKYIDTSSEIKTPFRTGLELIGGPLLCLPSDVGVIFKDGGIEKTTSHRYKIFEWLIV